MKSWLFFFSVLALTSCTNKPHILSDNLASYATKSSNPANTSTYTLPHDNKRIVFIGDSITYAGDFVAYFESYMRVAFPNRQFEIVNIGLPSETVSGLSEVGHAKGAFPRPDAKQRLQRSLDKLNPDLVFSCYGMNDGIYLPFDQGRFMAFKRGINNLHMTVLTSGAELTHLTPPDYDARLDSDYSSVLDHYSTWLLSNQQQKNWQVIDTHFPMQKSLEENRRLNSEFYYSRDGIHPNTAGHWQIAKSLLIGLSYPVEDTFAQTIKNLNSSIDPKLLFNLVKKQQTIMKDAYLTDIGHERPRMKKGLSLKDAKKQTKQLALKLQSLLR
ncbi:SGNH/GDSL hydrolase family protein [Paraglaciecola sp.]|uniref:SGNH/GDSL hydrolase family protein n=1 Tax=Paraglaciecola sp. TaxID=1920173 RepID=UPI003EF4F45F